MLANLGVKLFSRYCSLKYIFALHLSILCFRLLYMLMIPVWLPVTTVVKLIPYCCCISINIPIFSHAALWCLYCVYYLLHVSAFSTGHNETIRYSVLCFRFLYMLMIPVWLPVTILVKFIPLCCWVSRNVLSLISITICLLYIHIYVCVFVYIFMVHSATLSDYIASKDRTSKE